MLATRVRTDRRLLMPLVSVLVDSEDVIRWRAIEALGQVAAADAEEDLDRVREIIRRLLWSMNEESGGSLRHAPEALGEILARVPVLIDEYATIVASFADEQFFRPAVHWALARIAATNPAALADYQPLLRAAAHDPDPQVRAWAGVALRILGQSDSSSVLAAMTCDSTPMQVYRRHDRNMHEATVAEVVAASPGQLF